MVIMPPADLPDGTVDNLARIFKATQSSVYLTSYQGASAFPSSSGFFSSLDLMTGGGTFQPLLPLLVLATNQKIYQRTIFLGQLEGDKIVQDKALIIPFQESEACLSIITTKVKEALAMGADENIILTDSQGNLLLDSPGTKGSSYWKQSSRRFFAIKEDVFAEMGRRKRRKLG
ncbi:uncharacterized protein LOC121641678 [Tachysurus ichikawai]